LNARERRKEEEAIHNDVKVELAKARGENAINELEKERDNMKQQRCNMSKYMR
jgi:hypothetical protein